MPRARPPRGTKPRRWPSRSSISRCCAASRNGITGPPAAILPAQDAIAWADHLVLIYPLWLGTLPAIFKAFLEQALRPGFAVGGGSGGFAKRLKGKSARVVVTMGMPAFVYRWYFGAHSLKSLERNILRFCGIAPIRETLIGSVESLSEARRRAWLDRMRALGARAN
jgi:putative NADPH-quinone reductase